MPVPFSRSQKEILADRDRCNKACKIVREGNFEEAAILARQVREDWYRCQALSVIARHAKSLEEALTLIDEALEAAYMTEEPNRIVVVGSWPIEVLSLAQEYSELKVRIEKLINVANSEPHPVRRVDAFYWLWSRLRIGMGPDDLLKQVLYQFWEAAKAAHGWRRDRCLRYVAVVLARRGWQADSTQTVDLIENPRVKRQTLREMQSPPERYDYAELRAVELKSG